MINITKQEYKNLIEELVMLHNGGKHVDVPNMVCDKSVKRIIGDYEHEYNGILVNTIDKLEYAVNGAGYPSHTKQAKISKELEHRLLMLNKTIQKDVSSDLVKAHVTGRVATTMAFLKKVDVEDVMSAVEFSTVNNHMIATMVADTMQDLLAVSNHTSVQVKKVIRSTFGDAMRLRAMTGENTANIKKMVAQNISRQGIEKKMLADGFIGIVDKAGRNWKLKTYVDMAVTTKNHDAYVEGVKVAVKDYDTDVAKIPVRNSKDPCRHYEGMLISMNGDTDGYPSYAQLRGTGMVFHPRCRHSPVPVGDTDMLHDDDIKHHNKQIEKLNKHVADEMPKP